MRDFRDAKAMAQTLRDALKTKSVSITHSESLELIARTFGLPDWNYLAAKIQASEPAPASPLPVAVAASMPAGAGVPILPSGISWFFHRWSCRSSSGAKKPGALSIVRWQPTAASSWSRSAARPMTIPRWMRFIRWA